MRWDGKGEVGITYMVVLIGSLVVSGTAASVMISTADQSMNIADDVAEDSLMSVVQGIIVIDAYCEIQGGDIQNINLLVKLSPGSPEINLDSIAIVMTTESGIRYLSNNISNDHYTAESIVHTSECLWNDEHQSIGHGDVVRLSLQEGCSNDFTMDIIPANGFKTVLTASITTDHEGFVSIM